MSQLKTLRDLLIHELRDLYSAETQLLQALPKMANTAHDEELQASFEEHFEQTKMHVDRLEQIFEDLGETFEGDLCKGMQGLIEEGNKMIAEDAEAAVHDAGLIAAAQRIEHYEIAAYGTARSFASILGEDDVVDLLAETLEEEKSTDEKLTALAESAINLEAAEPNPE